MLSRPATRTLSLVLALAALAVLPGPALAVDPGVVTTGATNNIDEHAMTKDLLGGWPAERRWVRVFVSWAQLEPDPGRYESNLLSGYDARVAGLRREGINVLMVVTNAPGWSHPSSPEANSPPANPATFGDFMAFLADRYAGQVAAFELWNEPDDKVFWKDGPQPAAYAALVKAAYPRIKAAAAAKGANPMVLTGGLVGNHYDFLEALYDHGAKGHFDGVGVHTDTACLLREPEFYYREESGRIGRFAFTGYREVRQTLLAHGDDKPVWITEIGWSTTPGICNTGTDAGKKPGGVSEAQQADFLRRGYSCLAGDPFVQVALWFSLQDVSTSQNYDHRLGLIQHDGTPKPSFTAFKQTFSGAGPAANPRCGAKVDLDAPTVTLITPGEYFDRLSIKATATDPTTPVGRMELYADGKRVPGSQDGATFTLDWLGARELAFGKHEIEVRAVDEAKNVGKAVASVVRVNAKNATPTAKARFTFKIRRKPGRRLSVYGRVLPPLAGGPAEKPKGRVRIFFERKSGKRWKPTSRFTKGIAKPIRFTYKARKPGRWRVYARYAAQAPYKNLRTKHFTFKL